MNEEHEKNPQRTRRAVLISLLIVITLILTAFVSAYAYYKNKLQRIQRSDGKPTTEVTINDTDPAVQDFNSQMQDIINNLPEEDRNQNVEEALLELYKDDDVFNILLIGTDERTKGFNDFARGDTCILLSLNKKDFSIRLVSFERGMGVPILQGRYKGKYDWLTHTFEYGGADLMMRTLRECFKVDVDHYIRVNFTSFTDGIDAIGGVDITLTKAEAKYINNAVAGANVQAGPNHLDGQLALVYARCRKIDSDWQRIQRQRTVVQAAMNQVKDLNLMQLDAALNQLLPLVLTNLTDSQITDLLLISPKFQGVTAEQLTIPVKGTYGGMIGMGGRRLFSVNFNKNSQILRNFLHPDVAVEISTDTPITDTANVTKSNTTNTSITDTANVTESNTTDTSITDTANVTESNTTDTSITDTANVTESNTTDTSTTDTVNVTESCTTDTAISETTNTYSN